MAERPHITGATLAEVRVLFDYDPLTGTFRWKAHADSKRSGGKKIGDVAGTTCRRHGYTMLRINRRTMRAHRVAWLMMTGTWPSGEVDHRNRIRSDNRWENLRLADNFKNAQNLSISRRNSSGVKGVHRHGKKWATEIMANGERKYLGIFDDFAEAVAVRQAAEQRLFGEFRADP